MWYQIVLIIITYSFPVSLNGKNEKLTMGTVRIKALPLKHKTGVSSYLTYQQHSVILVDLEE